MLAGLVRCLGDGWDCRTSQALEPGHVGVLARHDAFRVRAVRVGQVDEQGQRAAGSKCCHDGVRAGEAGHLDVVGIPVARLNTHSGAFNNFLYDCARLSAVQTRVSVASYRRAQVDNARPGGVGSDRRQR